MKKLLAVLLTMLVVSVSGFARVSDTLRTRHPLPGQVAIQQMLMCYQTTERPEWDAWEWCGQHIRIGNYSTIIWKDHCGEFTQIFEFWPYTPDLES